MFNNGITELGKGSSERERYTHESNKIRTSNQSASEFANINYEWKREDAFTTIINANPIKHRRTLLNKEDLNA